MRIIKRYQNRKLYDTKDSCYKSLKELRELSKSERFQVVDNKTKKDITSKTYLQMIFSHEMEKDQDLNNLEEIIKRDYL